MEAWKLELYHGSNEIYHHGILGQKWGVRRFQNSDGTYTAEGKARRNGDSNGSSGKSSKLSGNRSERNKKIAKYAIAGTIGAATVAAAAIYVKNNPQIISKVGSMKDVLSLKMSDFSKYAKEAGKKGYVKALTSSIYNGQKAKNFAKDRIKDAKQGFKEGIIEGAKEGPKKFGKAIMVGLAITIGKKVVDRMLGSEESAKVFQANNNKKIDKFWKVNDPRDFGVEPGFGLFKRTDDDDEDD